MIKIIRVANPEKIRSKKIRQNTVDLQNILTIALDVSKNGDAALKKYEKKFAKNPKLLPKTLRVSKQAIKKAHTQITKDQLCAIKLVKKRLENTEKKTLLAVQKTIKAENCGVKIQRSLEALESVGCYVPGGGARYPSSAVMSTLPAKIAGVKRIIVCSPPDESGSIDPLTLVAADICGATEIYSVGGPHAVSAMAYGTKSIAPVDKIVGPGGKYVTLAKQFVNSYTRIDMSAGPTELLIVADSKANPALICADLYSQAEHGPHSWCALMTDSENLAKQVQKKLKASSTRKHTLNIQIYLCKTRGDLIKAANAAAVEHLQVMTVNPDIIAKKITTAGLVLVGENSPSAASDYLFGTNHILPTDRDSRVRGSLSVLDFLKLQTRAKCSSTALYKMLKALKTLTDAEGLNAHYNAAEARFK